MTVKQIILQIKHGRADEGNMKADGSPVTYVSTVCRSKQDLLDNAELLADLPTPIVHIELVAPKSEPAAAAACPADDEELDHEPAAEEQSGERFSDELEAGHHNPAAALRVFLRRFKEQMLSMGRVETFRRQLDELSARQSEVLLLIAEGRTCKEIAAKLKIGLAMATRHRAHLFKKLSIRNSIELAYLINAAIEPKDGGTPVRPLHS